MDILASISMHVNVNNKEEIIEKATITFNALGKEKTRSALNRPGIHNKNIIDRLEDHIRCNSSAKCSQELLNLCREKLSKSN